MMNDYRHHTCLRIATWYPFLTAVVTLMLPTLICGAERELPLAVAEIQRSEPVDFGTDILPLLKRNCLACHHQKEAEGGLVLETLAAVLAGGDTGPGVVAHDAAASLLLTRATGAEEPLMPPEDNAVGALPLTADELGLLKLWIEQGAAGSDDAGVQPVQWQAIPESIRSVYALDVAPDNTLAAVGRANRVVIVDLRTNAEISRLVDPDLTTGPAADVDLIQSIAFSPDGNRLATGGLRTVRLWKKTPAAVSANLSPLAAATGLIATNDDQTSAAVVNAIGDVEVWDLANQQRLHVLRGHSQTVTGLAYATQANRIVAGQQFGALTVWDAATGTKVCEYDAQVAMDDLVAAGDGTMIAILNAARKVELLRIVPASESEPAKIERVHEALGGISDALAVQWVSQPAPLAVVASESAGVVFIEPSSNQNVRTIPQEAVVHSIAVSADQTKLVTGGRDGKIRVWNVADGQPITTAQGSQTSHMLISRAVRDAARETAEIARLTAKTAALETLLKQEDEALAKATEARDKAVMAVTDATAKHVTAMALVATTQTGLDAANVDAANTPTAETKAVVDKATIDLDTHTKAAAVTADAKTKSEMELVNREQAFATATAAHAAATAAIPAHLTKIQMRTLHAERASAAEKQVQQQFAVAPAIVAVTFSPDAQRIAGVDANGATRVYATADGLPLSEFPATDVNESSELHWITDSLCVTAPSSRAELLSTVQDWQLERTIGGLDSPLLSDRVTALDFGRDGMALAAGSGAPSRAGEIKIFAVPSGELLRDFGDVHSDTVHALDFSPDGLTLASGAADKTIRLLNIATGQTERTLEGHSHHVLGVSWQDNGRALASASADLSIKVWDVESGQVTRTITGFPKEITSVEFVGTTNQVIAALAHGEVRLIDTSSGAAVRNFAANGDFLFAARVSDDGKKVIAGGQSGMIRVWNFENAAVIAELP